MKKIVLFEPSISSLNLGDYIIVDSIKRELNDILYNAYVVEQPTQVPLMHFYQKRDARLQLVSQTDYKFVCGSNLFWQNMFSLTPQWNYNIFNYRYIKDSIFVGVGCASEKETLNKYTTNLYKKVLTHNYIHSVRDNITQNRLERLGFEAINTGCATLWSLTRQHCNKIPDSKSESVVFTLTDYSRDIRNDLRLIEILKKNYNTIYYWPQGYSDYSYLEQLGINEKIKILPPNLAAMKDILIHKKVDYIGTRLHGGIFAMQNLVRSIIIIIDNRARDMKKNYNIPSLEREHIEYLDRMINSTWNTLINIDEAKINQWKEQFK